MTEQEFRKLAVDTVVNYTNKHLDKTDGKTITADDVFVVWQVKVLQNNKALLSTALLDGMYYECTYNGDKDEMYVDCYKKLENFCVSLVRYDNKLTIVDESNPPAKFSVGTIVELADEGQVFAHSQYLREHNIFPILTEADFARFEKDYDAIDWEDMLNMRGIVCGVGYDASGKRYVYIIQAEGNKFFVVAEDGLRRVAGDG